ncbi:MAG: hypothetical protein Q8R28_04575 [Dehalococcoidia bacterium]|nr:hypothetical protein [Dehalococcoidia bacterium]
MTGYVAYSNDGQQELHTADLGYAIWFARNRNGLVQSTHASGAGFTAELVWRQGDPVPEGVSLDGHWNGRGRQGGQGGCWGMPPGLSTEVVGYVGADAAGGAGGAGTVQSGQGRKDTGLPWFLQPEPEWDQRVGQVYERQRAEVKAFLRRAADGGTMEELLAIAAYIHQHYPKAVYDI